MSAAHYIETPPEMLPAIGAVDALGLYQDFLAHRITVPEEVKLEANRQANEGTPSGWITVLEEYQGRLRTQTFKK